MSSVPRKIIALYRYKFDIGPSFINRNGIAAMSRQQIRTGIRDENDPICDGKLVD